MKGSLESILNKLIAKVELAPLYDPVPLEPGDSEIARPKGGGGNGGRGTEGCGYSRVGFNDLNYMWGNGPTQDDQRNARASTNFPYGECDLCRGDAPPAICACISAYHNPCYNWHWSNGFYPTAAHPDSTWEPPAYPSYPPGCPSAQELDGPGYTEEEWIGNPETLSGQRYRWFAWPYLTRTKNPNGSWANGQLSPLDDSIEGFYGSEHPNPLDPNDVTMRQIWAEFFRGGYGGYRPTLMQRKILESGCRGNPIEQVRGSCCTFSEFGTASCQDVESAGACDGVFTAGGSCSGANPCGGQIQQNDQGKKQKEAMDMVMSLLKRK
jgi:hypothetical protein